MNVLSPVSGPQCGCHRLDVEDGLLSVDEALQQAKALVHPIVRTEEISLELALGRVLAKDVFAQESSPRFDNSAMDGYAVSTAHIFGDGPLRLPIQDRIAAGDEAKPCNPASGAVQIFTGARIPAGFDAVVMQEDTSISRRKVSFAAKPYCGMNIRKAGEEFRVGTAILRKSTVLGVAEIACVSAAGKEEVSVFSPAKVALLVSGNEIKPAGTKLDDSDIFDINTPMMQAAMSDPTVVLSDIARVSDSRKDLSAKLKSLAGSMDVIVVTGGASVGEEDHLKTAIKDAGGSVAVSGVAIKPGKPITFGCIGKTVLIGLPGNPLSAFVTWKVLGQPVVDRLVGKMAAPFSAHHVKAGRDIRHKPGRCEYRPARVVGQDGSGVEIIETNDATHSARMTTLLGAAGLIRIPSSVDQIKAGDLLEFLPF